MTFVGKPVYNISGVNIISFGTVLEEKMENKWTWCRVNWINQIPANPYDRLNFNPETGWFRCDTIKVFEPSKMISEISELIIE